MDFKTSLGERERKKVVVKTIKVMLIPNNIQQTKMFQYADAAKFAFNWTLAKEKENYENGSKFISDSELRKEFTRLRNSDEYAWLQNVSNNVTIGNGVKVQNNVSIYEGVELEDYVFCGPSCVFTNDLTPRARYPKGSAGYKKTLVKHDASIGANATIVCGHTIGEYALIAAGAVVTKNVPAHALMAGVPAKRIGWACECGAILPETLKCE